MVVTVTGIVIAADTVFIVDVTIILVVVAIVTVIRSRFVGAVVVEEGASVADVLVCIVICLG